MNEKIQDLQGKKIAILGLGLENLALVRYILKHKIKCEITICDKRKDVGAIHELPLRKNIHWQLGKEPLRKNIHWQLGKEYNRCLGGAGKNLEKFDILFRSPGWPTDRITNYELRITNLVSSPMKLFFQLCPTRNIIGVTGTKGKGTTASLIYEILKKHFSVETRRGASVHLGGNIGMAPFEFIDKLKKTDWVVLELSSFQLEDMTASPPIAVITNFYPEHLAPADPNNPNYHKTLKEYWRAKMNIIKWQGRRDKTVLNYELRIMNYELKTQGKKIYFGKSELPSKLIGEHNQENIAAAVAVAKIVGVKQEIIKKAVANFKGLEHRLEFVRELNGVKYYNDSFATTPESTIIALKSFSQPIILLAGGAEKKSNFSQLVREIKKRVKFAVLLKGVATARLNRELLKAGYSNSKIRLVSNIKSAIARASQQALKNDIILLSPACASFGMFKNYKERGNLFKQAVNPVKKGFSSGVKKFTPLNNFAFSKINSAK
ncbi:UDP-N-acetylmuramoyl-L-alanine--D-glutamate ligase [Candidatus Falkowbacteria bacterium CG_4_9_14_3_um_filter_38_19]|uniref:UDP-N-acetylmuramoylalanine--D-glutamate ligase n=2 Tax=Candidatus Falkowiibacteriota TaxID=1752728 RepID=A0A2M6WQ44_9BACT|nr:MAG: UDP-N-acetylmuramoyl-L-alanine--D-glutamate ligase [Candidatus Falkowbacteria bacterium CG10_big_fil_rev_8_21_14_0_10_38_22]PJB16612.1 MAG: UDP-N-acetylmuramoyl-L-alanine--D-glutamate ligase [Candidatus Falkowbacteria bacterium CG_4_9_14_3_um_filter_38_19]